MRSARGLVPLVLLGAAGLSGCASKSQKDPGGAEPKAAQSYVDEKIKALEQQIQRDFATTAKTSSISNNLSLITTDVRNLQRDLSTVLARLDEGTASLSEADRATLQPLRDSMEEMRGRLSTIERDLNSSFDDIRRLREEVRLVLGFLESYRDASRAALHIRREALEKELELLSSVLDSAPDQAKATSTD